MNRTESAGRRAAHRSRPASSYAILSYNLQRGRAADELEPLAEFEKVDLLFVQEARTEFLPDSLAQLSRLTATENGRLGLALYGASDRFVVEAEQFATLGRGSSGRPEARRRTDSSPDRLVAARLFDRFSGRRFVAGSFHASSAPLGGRLRRRQLRQAHALLDGLGGGLPTLLIGDLRHRSGVGSLRRMLATTGHTLSTATEATTSRLRRLCGRVELVAARGLLVGPVRVLPRGKSDHLPITATASFPH